MMAAPATRLSKSPTFDDHISLDASMEEYDRNEHSPALSIPSQHSGFKSSEGSVSEHEDERSEAPWSPPAWRNTSSVGGWYRHQPYSQDQTKYHTSKSASRSRETSHESYESAIDEEGDDTTRPANIPLPRGSMSPVREIPHSPIKKESRSPTPFLDAPKDMSAVNDGGGLHGEETSESPNNNCLCYLDTIKI